MNTEINPPSVVGDDALLSMIHGGWVSQALCAAATLKLPDHLAAGATTVPALARAAQCDASALSRLMRALASLNIVQDCGDDTYQLTPMGQRLRSDTPDSLSAQAQWFGRYCWPLWGELVDSVQTGVSARVRANGQGGYAHLLADPEASKVFNQAMQNLTRIVASSVVATYDFTDVAHIVDVGGGHGELLIAILAKWPRATGQLIELAHAIPGARQCMIDADLSDRVTVDEGDFFAELPSGADAYLLKAVLHNWDDAHCARILTTLSRAASTHARLLVIDRVLPDRVQPTVQHQAVTRSDLNMLVGVGGRERTAAEITSMLRTAGFNSLNFVPLAGAFNLIDARR